jgi:hypothetical protein
MATNKLPARGRHLQLRLTRDGEGIKVFTFTNFSAKEDAEVTASSFLGEPTKISSREHNGWEVEIDGEMSNSEFHDLEDAVIRRDKDRQTPAVVNATEVIYYRDGSNGSWAYTNLALKFDHSAQGREGFIKFKMSGRCDKRVAL